MSSLITFFRKSIHKGLLLLRNEPLTRKPILRALVWMHNWSYHLISLFASFDGTHPKHDILKYHEFFLDRISSIDTVLDVGSGSGKVAYELAGKAAHVYGIDIRPVNVERARKAYQANNLSFIEGDATVHDFDRPVTVIVLSNVLEHIEDRVGLLQKLSQLAPKILIRVPMITRDWITVFKRNEGFEYRLDDTHYIEYAIESFEQEMKEAELQITELKVEFGELYAVVQRTSTTQA